MDGDTLQHQAPMMEPTPISRDQPVGESMSIPKSPAIFRLHMQNPNGISVGHGGDFQGILQDLEESGIDLYMAPETKLNTRHEGVQDTLHHHCRKVHGRRYKLVATSSTIRFPSQLKPGGVLALITGKNAGRVASTGADPFGRWVYLKLTGGHGRCITVVATYQVCKGNPKLSGPTTAITQQYSMMEQANRPNPTSLRRHHSQDLVQFVKGCQANGELIVVGGDFNETLGDDASGLTRLCSECQLVDPQMHSHGHTQFSSQITGSKCIDYILMDPALMPSVRQTGYEPFGARIVSDHRGVYVDVMEAEFFGADSDPNFGPPSRVYKSNSIQQTRDYFNHLNKHLLDHDWFNQLETLKQCMTHGIPNHDLAEKLDQRRIAACLYAENCLKVFPRAPYSPALRDMRRVRKYLKAVIQCKAHPSEEWDEVLASHLRKLAMLNIQCPESLTDCRAYLREHTRLLRTAEAQELQNAPSRKKHQEAAIKEYMVQDTPESKKMAQVLRRIQRAEATAAVFQQCAQARGLTKEGGLSYVEVPVDPQENPKHCTDWRRIHDPKEVEEAIRNRLKLHFSQSKDCNLTSPPFDVTMAFEASCHRAEQILTGSLPPGQLDDMTQALLDCFAYVGGPEPAVEATMTRDDLLGKIKAWHERTSTSPVTNVHLGHAKAYIARSGFLPNTPESEAFEAQRDPIITGHLHLMNYALQFGYSYHRWQIIVNSMLEKDPGRPRIHRLRVIHLYEWDFNLLLCVKWRQLLHHVCDRNLVNSACYGTMPGRSSMDPVFVRELEYEIARMTRRPLIHFDNDATSCYDRIPCFLANLASRKYGLDKNVCIVQARTLAGAKYYLRTKLGISEEYAEHTLECPWFGTGQGSGNSPFYWLLISSTLYDLYCSKTTGGAHYVSPDGSLHTKIHLLGFVDDVNNRTTLAPKVDDVGLQATLHSLIQQASTDSQLWHDILTAANQELELSKCKYHIIHFQFDDSTGTPSIVDTEDPPQPLQIKGKNGQEVSIAHVSNSTAIKYLGCHKCPSNQLQQKQVLQAKCDEYARVVNCSNLSRRGAQVFYQAIYRLSVGYPLSACYFSKQELDTIQKKAHTALLRKSGYGSKTSLGAVYGPAILGGAEFFHLYDEQGCGQVSTFMKFWRSPRSHAGILLRIALSWAQYSVGISTPILLDPQTKLHHLEAKWISSLRTYLKDTGSCLELDETHVPPLQREYDQCIMDAVLTSGAFQPKQIRMINYCRLYLRVSTVADITTANGRQIHEPMFSGAETAINKNSKWYHVHQKRPGPKAWTQWRRFCRSLCMNRNLLVLEAPLGDWIVPREDIRRIWDYWHDPATQMLYRRRSDGTYCSHRKLTHDYDQTTHEANVSLPASAVPVDVKPHELSTWSITPTFDKISPPAAVAPVAPQSVLTLRMTLEDWELPLLQHLELLVAEDTLEELMTQGPVVLCSDGSMKEGKASFGWIMSTVDGQRLVQCRGPCFGAAPTSYRAEGYGILSACRFLYHWGVTLGKTLPTSHLYCDNKSMINRSLNHPRDLASIYPNERLASEWDVIIEIWYTLQDLQTVASPSMSHIKGHQDRQCPYDKLTLSAQLNVDADSLADSFLADFPELDYSKATISPHTHVQLHSRQGTITHKTKRTLRDLRTTPLLVARLQKKYDWSDSTFNDVNWEAGRQATNRLRSKKTTLIKHLNNISPVGALVSLYDPKYSAECPSCDHPNETRQHLYQCNAPSRLEWKGQFANKLREVMDNLSTPADVRDLLLAGLQAVLADGNLEEISVPDTPTARRIAAAQAAIGWPEILKGRLSHEWRKAMQRHLGHYDPWTNGMTWTATIAETLLRGWLDLWELRNADRHGRDARSKAEAIRQQTLRELELLYGLKGSVMPQHAWILDPPLDQRKTLKTYSIRAFINCYKPILEESYKERLATG